MLINQEKILNGGYDALENWLQQNAGVEGVDYYFKYISLPSRPASGRISEIIFIDPKMETFAILHWG